MVSTSSAGEVAQCPVGSVPIQVVGEGGSSSVTTLPAATQSDFGVIGGSYPHFDAFVAAVTEHVAARLGRESLCLNSTESRERSLLQFMHWPINTYSDRYGPPTPVTSLDARPSNGCRISSPWIDIAIERKPLPWIRAIVRWNDRQFLADQAVLARMPNVPPSVAQPLTNVEFGSFIEMYHELLISVLPELRSESATKQLEKRIPPDILWLLRRSKQSMEFFHTAVKGAMSITTEKNADSYTKLVLALIDRCLASDGADINYNSILDVADLISLEQYKITTPITELPPKPASQKYSPPKL